MKPIDRKPRILFIIDFYPPHMGGLEVVFENLVQRLLERGYQIGILTIRHMSTLPRHERHGNLEIRRVGKNRTQFLRYSYRRGKKLARQFDCIHTTTYASAISASLVGQKRRKPVILTIHEVFGPKLWKRYKPYRRRLYQRFEQIIFWFPYTHKVCVSEYTKRMLHNWYKLPLSHLKTIPNGIDTSIWTLSNKQESLIEHFLTNHHLENNLIGLYYGHSGASKGLDYLLKSLPKIIEKHPTFKLILNLIPGKRDYYIHQLIKHYQLEKHIVLLHGVQQHVLVNLVLLADMVIVPSVSEGFGLAAAEVSSLGQPLIVSKNGALPEVVGGKVVFLHSLKPDSFVAAVDKVVARQRHTLPPKSFSREETVNQYEALYTKQKS